MVVTLVFQAFGALSKVLRKLKRKDYIYADISKLFSCLASLVGEFYIVGRILYIGLGNSLLGKFTYLRTRSLLNGTQNTRPVFELNAPYINIEFVNDVMGCLCYLNLSPSHLSGPSCILPTTCVLNNSTL